MNEQSSMKTSIWFKLNLAEMLDLDVSIDIYLLLQSKLQNKWIKGKNKRAV